MKTTIKGVAGAALVAFAILLSACTGLVDSGVPDDPSGPELHIEAIDRDKRDAPWTVVVDATAFAANEYHLDAGDDRPVMTNSTGVFTVKYQERGAYVIRVQLGGNANEMAVPLSCPGCPPGPPGTAPPGAPDESVRIVWGVVDLSGGSCQAVIVPLRNGVPSTSFWAWDEPSFWGGCSSGTGNIWYLWEAERRYRPKERTDNWIPGEGWEYIDGSWTPWHVPAGYVDRHRHQGETWSPYPFFMVPGSGKTPSPISEMQYRITLTVTDAHGCRSEESIILTVYTGC